MKRPPNEDAKDRRETLGLLLIASIPFWLPIVGAGLLLLLLGAGA